MKPEITKGTVYSTVFLADHKPNGAARRHAVINVYSDGSGSFTIYGTYPNGKVIQQARWSLTAEDFKALRETINSQIGFDGGR